MAVFVDRNYNSFASTRCGEQKVNVLAFIDDLLAANPGNTLSKTGVLYRLGMQQYNANLKMSMVRPTVPSWFCGKINATTGELFEPSSSNVNPGSDAMISSSLAGATSGLALSATNFAVDKCLENGLPGSPGYALCVETGDLPLEDQFVNIDDWYAELADLAAFPPQEVLDQYAPELSTEVMTEENTEDITGWGGGICFRIVRDSEGNVIDILDCRS